jgi:hypothetical protein
MIRLSRSILQELLWRSAAERIETSESTERGSKGALTPMDWLKFFVLVLSGVFAVYQYAMVRHDLVSHHSTPDLPSQHEPSNLDTIVYVLLLGGDLLATVIYALRFGTGGLANATAWGAVFCLGVCLVIAIWWVIPFRDLPPEQDWSGIPFPVSVEQTLRIVRITSAVFFLLGFLLLCASVSA